MKWRKCSILQRTTRQALRWWFLLNNDGHLSRWQLFLLCWHRPSYSLWPVAQCSIWSLHRRLVHHLVSYNLKVLPHQVSQRASPLTWFYLRLLIHSSVHLKTMKTEKWSTFLWVSWLLFETAVFTFTEYFRFVDFMHLKNSFSWKRYYLILAQMSHSKKFDILAINRRISLK